MLTKALEVSVEFRGIFVEVLDRLQDRIRICLYSDEVTPGSPLETSNDRKLQAVYWSVFDFGFPLLNDESFWFTVCGIRTSSTSTMVDGMSQLFKVVIRLFFGRPSGHDLRDGVSPQIPGENGPRLIFAQLGVMVQDERAHKASTQVKGSGGRKFCPFCQKQ